MNIKIGKFSFLNNFLPYYRLEQGEIKVIEALPKNLVEMLENGRVDFTPVPSFYYIENEENLRSYDFCVASKNSVLSVLVVSEEKMFGGGRIAVTNQTMTSVNLLKIILMELGMKNEVVVVNESKAGELLKHCPYALVIGDEAIKARMTREVVMDLGETWHDLTGRPMVFAISASLKKNDMSEVGRSVMESLEWGEKNIEAVVAEAEKRFGLSAEFLHRYFKSLTYRMGADEKEGLELFEEKCHEHGLL